ncbi:MAG: alpha-L-fucosidase [Fibrobacteres bacterium]|nr:alpha-L-fucosidase [Fibrobacterota bacterium]
MRTIRNGGFTSAILVAKHHDGFCHWPSAYTTQDVASSPWKGGKGDLVQEFVDSCRAYGIKPGIYMSIGDFHSEKLRKLRRLLPEPGTRDPAKLRENLGDLVGWRQCQEQRFRDHEDVCGQRPQMGAGMRDLV